MQRDMNLTGISNLISAETLRKEHKNKMVFIVRGNQLTLCSVAIMQKETAEELAKRGIIKMTNTLYLERGYYYCIHTKEAIIAKKIDG